VSGEYFDPFEVFVIDGYSNGYGSVVLFVDLDGLLVEGFGFDGVVHCAVVFLSFGA